MTSLREARRIFLDTAPLIYLVEKDGRYLNAVQAVFSRIDSGTLQAVTSPVSLAECLVLPYRKGKTELAQDFVDLIINGDNTIFIPIDQEIALKAAQLRAHYNLALSDAFQAAVALAAECDAFLTNDRELKRVSELNIILLDEILRQP